MSSSRSYAALFALMFVVALVAGYIVASSVHFGAQPVLRLGVPTATVGSIEARLITPSPRAGASQAPGADSPGDAQSTIAATVPTVEGATTYGSPTASESDVSGQPAAATATVRSATSTPRLTATATRAPTATVPAYQFIAEGAPVLRPDKGCYVGAVFGYVHDEQGQWLGGVQMRLSDPWGHVFSSTSKPAPDNGYYDFILGTGAATWTLVVVDAQGNQISPAIAVQHREGDAGCWYEVDFRRTRR